MRILPALTALSAVVVLLSLTAGAAPQHQPFTGRWNMTGTGQDSNRVYWLEVTDKGGQLSGMFLNRSGNPVALQTVKVENGELIFQMQPGRENKPGLEFRATLEGDKLVGRHRERERTINWIGVRPPKWPVVNANAAHAYGTPVDLFDGKSFDSFDTQPSDYPIKWAVEDGALTNAPPTRNLLSKQKFKDFKIQAEYKLADDSNSGIYLRGRYELQVINDFGKPATDRGHMAIYGRTAPLVNAGKPAGEWQTMEAVIVGNRVSVTLNGKKVQDNAEIQGITGGALDADELAPGPILIQGDHTKVWFRRITVTPIQ